MIRLFKFDWCDTGAWTNNPADVLRYWVPVVGSLGLLISKRALWVGAHYSGYNRRLCINLLPCVTFWITLPGGKEP
ncbi:MAG: hypothetical protein ACK5S6_04985 [bacterium]|jgi:hypothetical protein